MTKIKVRGYKDLVEVSLAEGREIKRLYLDPNVKREELISVGIFTGEKKDIGGIYEDPENKIDNTYSTELEVYYKNRQMLLALTPQQRAEKSAWGHFKLFYWGYKGEEPEVKMKSEVIKFASNFYEKNPKWTKPSVFSWYEFLNLSKDTKIDMHVLRILEQAERQELEDIQKGDNFVSKEMELEKKEEEVLDDNPFDVTNFF